MRHADFGFKNDATASQSACRIPQGDRNRMLRIIVLTLGILLSAWGGVIAYRAFFLEPSATVVLNTGSGEVHEYPDLLRAALGLVMLLGGASIAFFAARRKRV
jgi:hypothetical protein